MDAPARHSAHGHWLGELGPTETMPPLEGRVDADVVVIGGGYTGMWASWWITELEPDARVVILEAERCGTGPSGRNGGFVNAMWFSLATMRDLFGDRDAIAVARAAEGSVRTIGTWCEDQEVDAAYTRGGYLQVSADPSQDRGWEQTARACRELGQSGVLEELTGEEVRSRCESPRFRGGAFYPVSATVNPALLAAGLRSRLLDRGVAIHEGSRVRRLRAGGGVVVGTERGEVRAGAAILAVGAAGIRVPALRNRLTVTSSHMVVTEPVPDVLDEIGWTGGESITDSRRLVHYFRTTRDGRIAFGWGGGRVAPGARLDGRAEVDAEVAAQVSRDLVWFFPQLEGRRIEHAWGGPIDVSPTHVPMVGSLDPDPVHYAFGYTGNGVAPSQLAGRTLASLALDRRGDPTRLAIVDSPARRVPPEPFRYAGGAVVRRAMVRKERLEQDGRDPDLPTRVVAGIPDLIGIHVGR